jgi:hypothetical protein
LAKEAAEEGAMKEVKNKLRLGLRLKFNNQTPRKHKNMTERT